MDKKEATTLLFNIAKEIKRSYESPIILITMKDFADGIYRSLLEIRSALMHDPMPMQLAKIIHNFHIEWLEAVKNIEDFRKRIKETPREVILNALDFTIKCMVHRCTYFENLIQQNRINMNAQDRLIMQADLEIMNDMKDTVIIILQEKKHSFKVHGDQTEYLVKINYEIDELLNWLDRIYDNLAAQCSKVIHLHVPQLQNQLTKALKGVIDEVTGTPAPEKKSIPDKRDSKESVLRTMVRFDASHDLEVSKIVENIKVLEGRINKLRENKSSAVLALQHKVIYLEERLLSLENLKTSLQALQFDSSREQDDENDILDSTELQIFNHNLPQDYRCRLVDRLTNLWENALYTGDAGKSIISILSAVDMKDTDDIGEFTVDKYGRKIYSKEDGDYQLNERNELVEVNDDDKHIYYYDDCGRYYLDQKSNRIYKAYSNASEYELYPTGHLLKLKETRDGIEYTFDHRGRYYINEDGQRIYIDPDTNEEYELDGFENLVLIQSKVSFFEACPPEPMVIEECRYLQKAVGSALKSCLANVIMLQPADPIAFLADNLEKYKQNIEDRQKRHDEEIQMKAERQYYDSESVVPPHSYVDEGEEEYSKFHDFNMDTYQTLDSPTSDDGL